MNPESFEQFEVPSDVVGDGAGYLREGEIVGLQFFEGIVTNVELPKNMFLKVTYTENVTKGDTTSSVLKDATLETGISIKVPAFIKVGDVISVDTEDGSYRERKK
jgi:elongation factor P